MTNTQIKENKSSTIC